MRLLKGCLIVALLPIVLGLLVTAFSSREPRKTTPETPEQRATRMAQEAKDEADRSTAAEQSHREAQAWTVAQDYVKKHLQYPHDASFPWMDYTVRGNLDTGVYWVSSTVKAKNAFGAQLTHAWKAQLNFDAEAKQWSLAYLSIGDEVVYMDQATTRAFVDLAKAVSGQGESQTPSADTGDEKPEPRRPLPRPVEPAPMREWTDASGTHTVRARFHGMAFGTVKLEREDGTTVEVAAEKLSAADQQWIKDRK